MSGRPDSPVTVGATGMPVSLDRIRPGAVVAVVLGAGLLAWLLVRSLDEGRVARPEVVPARIVSVGELRALQGRLGHAIYWAGALGDSRYEFSQNDRGWATVEYRPSGLRVITYPVAGALERLRATARANHDLTLALPGGGLAIYHPSRADHLYVAYPEQPYQVEVVAPPAEGRRLARSGAIRPVS